MKISVRAGLLVIAFLIALAGCDSNGPSFSEEPSPSADIESVVGPNDYIVVLHESVAGKGRQIIDEFEQQEGFESRYRYSAAITGFAAELSEGAVRRLKLDPRVDYVERDREVKLPPITILAPKWCVDNPTHPACAGDGGGGGNANQSTPWGISRVGGAADGTGKTVWVIDTGVDLDHPDLNVDAGRSRTFMTRGKDSKSANDGNGHGTHVAGTIAAIDNGVDVVGVAAGATVVAVKVLSSSGSGSTSGVIAGVDYVKASAGAGDVANMSLGGGVSSALDTAVLSAAQAGVVFALAAGNESDDANNHSPARVNHNRIYTTSAIGSNDCIASFSNYGSAVDYAAPGVGVLSTYKDGGTATLSGTSMASPHMAGILLIGNPASDGTACQDPDDNADPIAHL